MNIRIGTYILHGKPYHILRTAIPLMLETSGTSGRAPECCFSFPEATCGRVYRRKCQTVTATPAKPGISQDLGLDNRRMNDGSDLHAFEPDWRLPRHGNPEATLPSLRRRRSRDR